MGEGTFTFVDLFAGIGGFHAALAELGGECVLASEWDAHARRTYERNFRRHSPALFETDDEGNQPRFHGDITELTTGTLPEYRRRIRKLVNRPVTMLTGGFPCQPFSHAGHRLGFEDERGNLFFSIERFLRARNPSSILLENVAGLQKHDSGRTYKTILRRLRKAGYHVDQRVLKASDHGLPQRRPRFYIVGFRSQAHAERFAWPEPRDSAERRTMSDILGGKCERDIGYTLRVGGRGSGYGDRHNWDSYKVNGIVRTLTPNEGLAMMGMSGGFLPETFPKGMSFPPDLSDAQKMKQLGNSVAVPVISDIAEQMLIAMGKA